MSWEANMINVELDLVLIKALLNKEVFDNYYNLIDLNTISEEAKLILTDLEIYNKEGKKSSLKLFTPWFIAKHNNWDSEKQEYYKHILSRIIDIDSEAIESVVGDLKKRHLWKVINEIKDSEFDTIKLEDTLKKFNSGSIVDGDLKYLKYDDWINENQDKSAGYKWRLSTIQRAWGNIKPKQLYLITAVTHTGKSSFITSEIVNICTQVTDHSPILYFNNERSESAILERFLCSYFKKDVDMIRLNRAKAIQSLHKKHPYTPLRVFSARDGKKTIMEVEQACKLYKPAAVVIDQLDKLVNTGDQKTRRPYENIYSWARDLAIKYNTIVIGATQYGVQKGKDGQVLTNVKMSQNGTFDATTDKSANTDYLIGIQNMAMYNDQKKVYLLRAKEGEEDIQFICKFNKTTGLFEDL